MVTLHLIAPDGARHTVRAAPGTSLMRAATDAGVPGIAADCGGVLSCATCHVHVDPAWVARLQPASEDERAMLAMTAEPAGEYSRLACQIQLVAALDGLVARVAARQY